MPLDDQSFHRLRRVSKAIVKWFEDEGRAKELGIVKVLPGSQNIRGYF
jgi:hypothetical protein